MSPALSLAACDPTPTDARSSIVTSQENAFRGSMHVMSACFRLYLFLSAFQ